MRIWLFVLLICFSIGVSPALVQAFGVESGACAAGCADVDDEQPSKLDKCCPCVCCLAAVALPGPVDFSLLSELVFAFFAPIPEVPSTPSLSAIFHPPKTA
jgi:hypothetical protein